MNPSLFWSSNAMTQPSPSTVVVVGMLNSAMSQVKTYVDTTKMT